MADDGAEVPNEETRPVPPETGLPTPPPGVDWETRFKYLLADFENFRRRSERDREGQTRQARGAVLRDLLPLLESFRSAGAAVATLPPSDPLRQGMDLLDREWSKFLKHQGVEPVAEVGKRFRSEEAEAVGETTVRDGCPDGSVAEIVQQGYRFFGGLLRPAKVIVARVPGESSPGDESDPSSETPDGGAP